ncbi:MAG: hypothetical protein MRZ45_11270 [Blautia sp.]|nr:hypothetical protein [Blautia sp.]MDY4515600.1 hypothetical protein [Lachnospiraceae bacterium]
MQKAQEEGAVCEFFQKTDVLAYEISEDAPVVSRFRESCKQVTVQSHT